MRVISILNQKGGVGKTTTTYNLAAVIAMSGKRVLMIDCDSQASLTLMTGNDPLALPHSVVDVFNNPTVIKDAIYRLPVNNVSLVPSSITLANMEARLLARPLGRETLLKKALDAVKSEFDCVLIDCPPALGLLTINALIASDSVLAPCETSPLSVFALDDLMNTIEEVKEINPSLRFRGVVATKFNSVTTSDRNCLKELQDNYTVIGVIKNSVAAKSGIEDGLPCVIANDKSDVAKSYVSIAEDLIKGLATA